MSKQIYILMALALSSNLLMATTLQTSDHLSNLEIITDTSCQHTKTVKNTSQEDESVVAKTQKVETVNYQLHGCNGVASFPVTVRSNKRQGE